MKTALSLVLILGAVFILPISKAEASFSNTTGSIDYVDYPSYGTSWAIGKVSGDWEELAWGYKPAASHNICTVTIPAYANGSPTDSLKMEFRLGTTTSSGGRPSVQGSHVAYADSSIQIRATSTTETTYTFTPCVVVVGASWYDIILSRTGSEDSSNYYVLARGSSGITFGGTAYLYGGWQNQGWTAVGSGAWSSIGVQVNGTVPILLNGTENFSAFEASTTTSYSSVTCTPPTNILDVGGGISYAFCFLFTPNASVIDQYGTLSGLVETKIPFSYISEFNTIFSSLSTSTSTVTGVTLPLHDTGIGSTSPIGNIIPNVEFNKASITHYLSDSVYAIFMLLQATAFWLATGFYIYRRVITYKP